MAEALRPIQYLGGKGRFLEPIAAAVAELAGDPPGRVVDLFSGTGVVARRIADDTEVLAADIQEYSRVLTSALLSPARSVSLDDVAPPFLRPEVENLLELEATAVAQGDLELIAAMIEGGSIAASPLSPEPRLERALRPFRGTHGSYDTMFRHYGGVYFGYRQALDLDELAQSVRAIPRHERDTALAALLGVASEISTSVGGHFAQPLRPRTRQGQVKEALLKAAVRTRARDVKLLFQRRLATLLDSQPPRFESAAIRGDFRAVLETMPRDVSCVYADPPYTREHYSRFYHVLETLALGDQPGVSTVSSLRGPIASRGLYRVDRHQSPFSIVSQAPAAFDSMFAAIADRGANLVLSYSPTPANEKPRARSVSIDLLVDLARRHFRDVRLLQLTGGRHSKLNSRNLHAPIVEDAENLLLARL